MKISRFLSFLVFTGLIIICSCTDKQQDSLTIHLVGDSTMANKPDPEHNPERGWGQLFPEFFGDNVTVVNHAVNGRSTRSFLDEGKWNRVMGMLQPGDYVFIQFGHNDQKAYDPKRYSNPWSAYRRNLELMVRETLERGGHPVLLSSIVRRKFNKEGTLTDSHGPYPFVARSVAGTMDVPFIDLQLMTEDMVSALGPERSQRLFMILEPGEVDMYPEGRIDNTHLRISGAREVAALVARDIREQELPLACYLKEEATLPRVLAIVGGHSYDTTEFFNVLASTEKFQIDSVSHPDAMNILASEYVYSYDALLVYDFIRDMPRKDSSIYLNLARRGMPMLFLHHALATFQEWDGYENITGGKYLTEEAKVPRNQWSDYRHDLDLDIRILDSQHPVTRGMEDFTIHDEAYSNLRMREGITPILATDHPDCSETVGWINHFDNSSTIYLLFGHDSQAYENPAFIQLLENSLGWLTATKAP